MQRVTTKDLAQWTAQIQQFQEDAFGASVQSPPMVRVPAKLFKDYGEKGSLALLLRKALEYKHNNDWRRFDFQSPTKRSNNIALLLYVQEALLKAGFIKRPRIHLHSSLGSAEHERLQQVCLFKRYSFLLSKKKNFFFLLY